MAPKRPTGESSSAPVKISRQKKKRSSSSLTEKKKGEAKETSSPPSTSSPPDDAADPLEPSDSSVFAELEAAILDLLRSRKPGTNCCPSEVPRRLLGERGDWRRLMPSVREAAARLVERGRLEITQRGVAVPDPRGFKGPIRLRLSREEG